MARLPEGALSMQHATCNMQHLQHEAYLRLPGWLISAIAERSVLDTVCSTDIRSVCVLIGSACLCRGRAEAHAVTLTHCCFALADHDGSRVRTPQRRDILARQALQCTSCRHCCMVHVNHCAKRAAVLMEQVWRSGSSGLPTDSAPVTHQTAGNGPVPLRPSPA